MAHYALLDENNVVTQVITGRNETEVVNGVSDWESYYGAQFGQRCLRTSYNTLWGEHATGGVPFRGNYAGTGSVYLEDLDAFVSPQPFPSWTLDETRFRYEPPIPYPVETDADGNPLLYAWNEDLFAWELIPSE